jgi:hypothetical protein
MQNLWVLGSTSELVNLTILAKKYLSSKFPEAKSQREKKKYTLGELWIVHNILSHEKSNYLASGTETENILSRGQVVKV